MASDETMTTLDDASAAAVRLMLSKLTDHDVTQVYETTAGQGPIADLTADAMRCGRETSISSDWRCARG